MKKLIIFAAALALAIAASGCAAMDAGTASSNPYPADYYSGTPENGLDNGGINPGSPMAE